jgi:hypothetical protein
VQDLFLPSFVVELDVVDHFTVIHTLGRPFAHLLLVHLLCLHCLLAKPLAQIAGFPPDDPADHNACAKNYCQHYERNGEPHDEQGSAYHHGQYLRQQARWTGAQSWAALLEPLLLLVGLHRISILGFARGVSG